ncbi:MAG: zinc-dependent alcohol dehydrogenase family protein [Deltaproteobacteria bacterium]|nr:zinc-dependent alcohol dehydrogenase family protein [Deltaproteobacteria bacterium]
MRAAVCHEKGPVEARPLVLQNVPDHEPGAGEIRVRVSACGVCRTDLHVVEGDLPWGRKPIIPGHQVVGRVERVGKGSTRFREGDRVGVAWLHKTCGECRCCRAGRENLCDRAQFTGQDVDGGYAELVVVPEAFAYPLPDGPSDLDIAPLLCAGLIGNRALRLSEAKPGDALAFIGFGGSAHVTIQVARHRGIDVYVVTRSEAHRKLARDLGAVWAGDFNDAPPRPFDSAVVFAPAGELIPWTLKHLSKGGTISCAGIHMSDIPGFPYADLWGERTIRSVANLTRADGEELLRAAAEIPIKTKTQSFPLEQANDALLALKESRIDGAAVLVI